MDVVFLPHPPKESYGPASPDFRGGAISRIVFYLIAILPLILGGDVDEGDRGGKIARKETFCISHRLYRIRFD